MQSGGKRQTLYGYDEFGNDRYGNQGELQPFGYTGYQRDKTAGSYFAQTREYLPGTGRFAGEDINKGTIMKPGSLNDYSYCLGNPLTLVDKNGRRNRNRASGRGCSHGDRKYRSDHGGTVL